ncbi:MAG: hypothetical protein EZS28_029777 [Streblomastix strix]|uniref:Uncharacterized protein n=1 Tax=Streblomastix strix TaxID=222440 RepID=A0A5J4UWN5_9EUKA|nr:MAG: hypothetical protein EZS28_029777 [Streblomastix strix]
MADADLHSLDVLIKHDETLYGNPKYNVIGLVEQVTHINNQINMINNAPAPDSYTRAQMDLYLDEKADKTDTYSKTEDDALLLLKANVADIVDSYSKTEDDVLLLTKADKTTTYTKTEDDALLLLKADKSTTYTKAEDDAMLLLKADKSTTYTKAETDTKLDLKADKTEIIDSYTKSEDDALLLAKADKSTTYTKSEDDALLLLKADKTDIIDSYSKSEDDALLLLKANADDVYDKTATFNMIEQGKKDAAILIENKADRIDLDNYVDLSSAQTISGAKQFGVISATTISKLTKNDASILLAGGGDMLVSSLVNQPQLQEVRDIASGRSKGYVFSTLAESNSWMAIPDNVANLAIGDNLYIVDSQVTDYWWDGTQLRELETQLPDLTNVVTTLGTATGSGNAITDLQITGNIITPAKNMTFVNTDYDQNISGSKLFTSTIHSYGINYQGYDNSSVFLAGGGVRSIADIQSNSYSKSEDDALLLLKADKTQLIDSYTKTQDDALLLAKADKTTTYTKTETDTKLDLKADKTQIIDSYTKTQDDALLLAKADKTTTYTKTETDTKLDLKADKTQIIDSCTKTEEDALLLLKADKTTTYTKTETDTKLDLKADKTQIIDSYTKAQDDALLLLKADVLTTYNKTKIDDMMDNKVDNQTLVNLVNTTEDQIVNGNKTFTNNVNATGFAKTGKDNTSILLAGGGDLLLSSLSAGDVDLSNYYTKTQDDALLLAKADKTTTYTKTETDTKLDLKADKT